MEVRESIFQQHAGTLLPLLQEMHASSSFSDLTISCEDGLVAGHRFVLGGCSQMVRTCFEGDNEEALLILPGVSMEEIRLFHHALYHYGEIPSPGQLDAILKVLNTIGVEIEPFIGVNQNVVDVTRYAVIESVSELGETTEKVIQVIHEHVDEGGEVSNEDLSEHVIVGDIKIEGMEILQTLEEPTEKEQEKAQHVMERIIANNMPQPITVVSSEASEVKKAGEFPYLCIFCKKKYKNGAAYEKHLATHDMKEPEEMKENILKEEVAFHCDQCKETFDSDLKLEKHKKGHKDIAHVCSTCKKVFATQQTLNNHIKLHVGDLSYQCGICSKSFVSNSVLGNHLKTHDVASKIPKFECAHCDKKFNHPSNLKRHVRTAHFEMSDKKTYMCTECGKTFYDPSALKSHSRNHLAIKPFACKTCNKTFSTNSQLNIHTRIHNNDRPFLCNLCGRCFVTRGQLKSHKLNRHVGVKHSKSHLCQECGQGFVKEFDLRVHMRKHTGERPFVCTDCGKSFRSERNLTNHCRIHNGDKPYKCETCGKLFTAPSGLRQHFKCHATCRLAATEGAYSRIQKKHSKYGRVHFQSIPEISIDDTSSLQTIEGFTVEDLKDDELAECDQTVVYFNTEDGIALVEGADMEASGVTIQAIGLEMDIQDQGEVVSFVEFEGDVETTIINQEEDF